ncbi:hypothetical protein PFISCL1PPCAC_17055, partial [Pristionchus fissidentatus]
MTRILPVLALLTLPQLRADPDTSKNECRRPGYLSKLPQRLQGEVIEIWTDPEPDTTLTYGDEPVIFKPSCEWRMSRTRMLISKLSRSEYYRIFPQRRGTPPQQLSAVFSVIVRPATPPPMRYSTAARARPRVYRPRPPPRRGSSRIAGAQRAPCRPPASVARLPPSVQRRIQ